MGEYDYIYNATDGRLNEMIQSYKEWLNNEPPYEDEDSDAPFTREAAAVLISEMSRRFMSRSGVIHFNDEAFSI